MIAAHCRNGHVSSAPANAHAVVSITTSAGTIRRIESVCDACGVGVSTYVDEWEAHAVSALVRGRAAIEALLQERLEARRN